MAASDPLRVIRDIESAMLSTWPAPRTVVDGSWIARFAGGYTKRANSLNCLDPDDDRDVERRLDWVEHLYRREGLPAIARISPLTPCAVDAILDRRGYRRCDETHILHAGLADLPPADIAESSDYGVREDDHPSPDWLAAHGAASARGNAALDKHRIILETLALPRIFLSMTDSGNRVVAAMLAVVHRDLLTVHDVATVPSHRRTGLARILAERSRLWGMANGATTGWIAVEADNLAAVTLFRSLGYTPCYRYHYRCGADPQ